MLQIDQVVEEVRPGPRDPPRLLGVGSCLDSNLTLYCYMDGAIFFTESDPIRALLLLISAFYVMGIDFPSYSRGPLLLLTASTMGVSLVNAQVSRNNKFVDLLKGFQLL